MTLKTTNYGTARSILGFLEICAWIGVGLGVLVAISAAGAGSRGFGATGLIAAIPGIFISITCLLSVAVVQMSKAGVDTADYTYQMLAIARDQLAVSKRALEQPDSAATFAGRPPINGTDRPAPELSSALANGKVASESESTPRLSSPKSDQTNWSYRGAEIERTHDQMFRVADDTFATLEQAKLFVDGRKLKAELGETYRGQVIEYRDRQFYVNGKGFFNRQTAETYIDRQLDQASS